MDLLIPSRQIPRQYHTLRHNTFIPDHLQFSSHCSSYIPLYSVTDTLAKYKTNILIHGLSLNGSVQRPLFLIEWWNVEFRKIKEFLGQKEELSLLQGNPYEYIAIRVQIYVKNLNFQIVFTTSNLIFPYVFLKHYSLTGLVYYRKCFPLNEFFFPYAANFGIYLLTFDSPFLVPSYHFFLFIPPFLVIQLFVPSSYFIPFKRVLLIYSFKIFTTVDFTFIALIYECLPFACVT